MIPTQVREPFHRPGWIYEEKVDGWRIVAYKDGERPDWVQQRLRGEARRRQTGAEETMLDRVMTWRFAVLVGVGLVDAAGFHDSSRAGGAPRRRSARAPVAASSRAVP
jgi:hypothetical protein